MELLSMLPAWCQWLGLAVGGSFTGDAVFLFRVGRILGVC
jgi:hypothetical protein